MTVGAREIISNFEVRHNELQSTYTDCLNEYEAISRNEITYMRGGALGVTLAEYRDESANQLKALFLRIKEVYIEARNLKRDTQQAHIHNFRYDDNLKEISSKCKILEINFNLLIGNMLGKYFSPLFSRRLDQNPAVALAPFN